MLEIAESKQSVVTAQQRAQFWRDGHAVVRRIADTEDIARHRRSIRNAVERLSSENRELEDRDTLDPGTEDVAEADRGDDTEGA